MIERMGKYWLEVTTRGNKHLIVENNETRRHFTILEESMKLNIIKY